MSPGRIGHQTHAKLTRDMALAGCVIIIKVEGTQNLSSKMLLKLDQAGYSIIEQAQLKKMILTSHP